MLSTVIRRKHAYTHACLPARAGRHGARNSNADRARQFTGVYRKHHRFGRWCHAWLVHLCAIPRDLHVTPHRSVIVKPRNDPPSCAGRAPCVSRNGRRALAKLDRWRGSPPQAPIAADVGVCTAMQSAVAADCAASTSARSHCATIHPRQFAAPQRQGIAMCGGQP